MLHYGVLLTMLLVSGDPSGETVLKRVEEARSNVKDFTATLDIEAHLEQVNVPPMHVTMYFKQPDKVHFQGEGFAIVPKEVVTLSPAQLLKHFTVESVERDTVREQKEFKLTLKPNDDRIRLRSASVYVHPDRWTIDRLAATLADGRGLSAEFTHQSIGGAWLPEELMISFTAPASAPAPLPAEEEAPAPFRRPALHGGSIVVHYSGYRINMGLDDALFAPERTPGHE